jgi:hypothetical protein
VGGAAQRHRLCTPEGRQAAGQPHPKQRRGDNQGGNVAPFPMHRTPHECPKRAEQVGLLNSLRESDRRRLRNMKHTPLKQAACAQPRATAAAAAAAASPSSRPIISYAEAEAHGLYSPFIKGLQPLRSSIQPPLCPPAALIRPQATRRTFTPWPTMPPPPPPASSVPVRYRCSPRPPPSPPPSILAKSQTIGLWPLLTLSPAHSPCRCRQTA